MQAFALLAGGVCAYILITYSTVNNNLTTATAIDISVSVISSGKASIQTEGYTIDTEVVPRKVYYTNDNRTLAGKSRIWCAYWQILAITVLGRSSLLTAS